MKKALTFLTVAALTATTQAALIAWDSGTIYLPDGTTKAGKDAVSAMVYLIDKTAYDAIDLSTADGQQKVLSDYLGTVADKTGTTNKSGVAAPEIGGAGTSESNPQYAVVIYQYGSGDAAQYKMGKGYDYINDLDKQAKVASTGLAGQTSWVTKSSGGQDPIPEPTTVALLALGLAAVGLKRKVA